MVMPSLINILIDNFKYKLRTILLYRAIFIKSYKIKYSPQGEKLNSSGQFLSLKKIDLKRIKYQTKCAILTFLTKFIHVIILFISLALSALVHNFFYRRSFFFSFLNFFYQCSSNIFLILKRTDEDQHKDIIFLRK